VEHAGFDRIAGDAENLGGLLHRFFVVVDEIDDLAMARGQSGQAIAQDFSPMLDLKVPFRIVGWIDAFRTRFIGRRRRPAPQFGERLVAGDRQEPSHHRRARLEPIRLPPDAEEHLAG
jgi:hypothetical protein